MVSRNVMIEMETRVSSWRCRVPLRWALFLCRNKRAPLWMAKALIVVAVSQGEYRVGRGKWRRLWNVRTAWRRLIVERKVMTKDEKESDHEVKAAGN